MILTEGKNQEKWGRGLGQSLPYYFFKNQILYHPFFRIYVFEANIENK